MFRRAALVLAGRNAFPAPTLSSSIKQINHKYSSLTSHHSLITPRGNLRLLGVRCFSDEVAEDWPDAIKKFLEREKIDKPTLIQERTLPVVMQGKDLVGIARTGSGKTLAFVIPAVMKILTAKEEQESGDRFESRHPTCLVLAPTRELAHQTGSVVEKFVALGLNSICLVGGSSRTEQMRQLSRNNHDIYIATPGRLMDLIESELVDLSKIKYLVLDEADRMLDMGFEPQIRKIIQSIPKDRQTVMWSATWPKEIQSLASEFMKSYEYIAVDSENLKANPNIKQVIDVVQPINKVRSLVDHLRQFKEECNEPRTLIFVNTKRMAETLLLHLMRNRVRAIAIHGDRSQRQRDDAIRMFRNRLCHVMVATDVAARGIDISDITHVINFDFPNTVEDYIHRIGRTARGERKGTAVSLVTENNANIAVKLIKVLQETDQPIPDDLRELANNKHRYFSDTQDFSNRRRNQRNDFYSGAPSQSRYSGQSQDFGQSRYQQHPRNRSRLPMMDDEFGELDRNESRRARYREDSIEEEDRYDRSFGNRSQNQGRRRSRSGLFDDE